MKALSYGSTRVHKNTITRRSNMITKERVIYLKARKLMPTYYQLEQKSKMNLKHCISSQGSCINANILSSRPDAT